MPAAIVLHCHEKRKVMLRSGSSEFLADVTAPRHGNADELPLALMLRKF
jgi:hypothetical protein